MQQILAIGALTLLAILTQGCGSESDRMANLAENMLRSQNEVNSTIARTDEKFVELNSGLQEERKELQKERASLNGQFQQLEQDRKAIHSERRSELAWSESFQFLATTIAAIMPLFLCAYLIWAATQSSVNQEQVNSILIHELVSSKPRLIAARNLPAIEDSSNAQEPDDEDFTNK